MESKLVRTYRDEEGKLVDVYEDTTVQEREAEVSQHEELDRANQVKSYLDRTKLRSEKIEQLQEDQEEDDDEFQHLLPLFSFEDEEEPITQ